MRRLGFACLLLGIGALASAVVVLGLQRRRAPAGPNPVALVERMREIARLETLEVQIARTIAYAPDPPMSSSLAGDVLNWVRWTVKAPEGRAIVRATARLGLDLDKLDASSMRVSADTVELCLPPLRTVVALDPGATEIIRSNLESADTAQLLDAARRAIEADVGWDRALQAKARASAERALREFLLRAGFREVRFVDAPPPPPARA